jgi:transcriptional antiterminator RfaH
MYWYVIHTKPREERRALLNLEAQDYRCFLPMIRREILNRNKIRIVEEPLFPRYLFIFLASTIESKSWGPIRSTLGVSRLLKFGSEPARIEPQLIELLRNRTQALELAPIKLYSRGTPVKITDGAFKGFDAVFEMTDGESRAIVLIEVLSKTTRLHLPITDLSHSDT